MVAETAARPFQVWLNVVNALLLRDIRVRAGRFYVGYIAVFLMPFAHLGIVLTIFVLTDRVPFVGTQSIIFFGLSILPIRHLRVSVAPDGDRLGRKRAVALFPSRKNRGHRRCPRPVGVRKRHGSVRRGHYRAVLRGGRVLSARFVRDRLRAASHAIPGLRMGVCKCAGGSAVSFLVHCIQPYVPGSLDDLGNHHKCARLPVTVPATSRLQSAAPVRRVPEIFLFWLFAEKSG
jgi:hypothetical protein